MGATFEWDPAREEANCRKHGVSFREAISAFMDPLSVTIPDPDHSIEEERFLLLGENHRGQLLIVSPHRQARSHSNHKCTNGRSP
jgi:uncharacterized DUF497 family protein